MSKPKLIQNLIENVRFLAFKKWPEQVLKFEFRRNAKYKLHLRNPKTFNEKLQWLKLYWYDPNATICADKYLVRDYVAEKGLGFLLNDLYGVYENVEQINFEELPQEFVMKVTHGCGQNLICTNKDIVAWNKEKRNFNSWLKKSHYIDSLEWVYRDIKPRIIVEKLIKTSDNKPPKDYKFFCFNGKAEFLFVASDRIGNNTKFDFYDLQWNKLDVKNYYPNSTNKMPKPPQLQKMIEYSEKLSKNFPHVRVDFYLEDNQVIFGEMTFFHFSGNQSFEPYDFDYKMGQKLKLPNEL